MGERLEAILRAMVDPPADHDIAIFLTDIGAALAHHGATGRIHRPRCSIDTAGVTT